MPAWGKAPQKQREFEGAHDSCALWGLGLLSGIGSKIICTNYIKCILCIYYIKFNILNLFSSSCTPPSLWSIHSWICLGWISQTYAPCNSIVTACIPHMLIVRRERVHVSLGTRIRLGRHAVSTKHYFPSSNFKEPNLSLFLKKNQTNHTVWKPYLHPTSLSLNILVNDFYRLIVCVPRIYMLKP